MGYLQGDTNNILIDAVLTDLGRQLLSRNDGSFSITQFAVGDDEIDYTLIQKFGRTVGQEKIEKNTPVFEAITNGAYAQKYRCISLSNPNIVYVPSIIFVNSSGATTSNIVGLGTVINNSKAISLQQSQSSGTQIDQELVDQSFVVQMDNRFLQVLGQAPDSVDVQQRASYLLSRDPNLTSQGGSSLGFTIGLKSISAAQFQIYGAKFNKNLINSFIRVSGLNSGAVLEFEAQITQG